MKHPTSFIVLTSLSFIALTTPNQTITTEPVTVATSASSTMTSRTSESTFSSDFNFDTIDWAGFTWGIRGTNDSIINWSGPQAAHPTTGEGIWVDGAYVNSDGDLVLESQGINGGVELVATQSLGYGDYRFEYSGDFNNYDPHTVLGIFTYDWSEMVIPGHVNGAGSTEIDFNEISRWGDTERESPYGGETMYPDDTGKQTNLSLWDVPHGYQHLTTKATWQPDYLRITTVTSDGVVLADVIATEGVPRADTQQLHLNLWTTSAGDTHTTARGDKAIFHEFDFTPWDEIESDDSDDLAEDEAVEDEAAESPGSTPRHIFDWLYEYFLQLMR